MEIKNNENKLEFFFSPSLGILQKYNGKKNSKTLFGLYIFESIALKVVYIGSGVCFGLSNFLCCMFYVSAPS